MDERIKFFVGLDAHKDSISAAACDASREPARNVGSFRPDVNGLLKVLAKGGSPSQCGALEVLDSIGAGQCRLHLVGHKPPHRTCSKNHVTWQLRTAGLRRGI